MSTMTDAPATFSDAPPPPAGLHNYANNATVHTHMMIWHNGVFSKMDFLGFFLLSLFLSLGVATPIHTYTTTAKQISSLRSH